MKQIRIKGLVKTMNRVREKLARGVMAVEAPHFRHYVTESIDQVEQICRNNQVKPEQLPGPSYRAYQFLKSVDLKKLPEPTQTATAPRPPWKHVRVTNMVTTTNYIQAQLSEVVKQPDGHQDQQALLAEIVSTTTLVEKLCREQNGRPSDLPDQSRRAYQWLKFLSEEATFQLHLATLKTVKTLIQKLPCRSQLTTAQKHKPVEVTFYHTAVTFRARVYPDAVRVVVSESYIDAPEPVLEALLCAALTNQKEQYLGPVKEYANSEEFTEMMMALELIDETAAVVLRGQHHDLAAVFERVNKRYFGGKMARPRLTWNRILTKRKMGHYQPSTDSVMISITLDQAQVPAYVVEFVMFHELLHKKLGIQVVNGRRYAHTTAFRAEERRFHDYEKAHAFLQRLNP